MEYAHILTIGTARSDLNPDSDVGVGGLILKLTMFLGRSFCLVYHFGGAWISRVVSLKWVWWMWLLTKFCLSSGPGLAPFSSRQGCKK